MPIAAIIGLVSQMLPQAVGLFAGDDKKLTKIADIASKALSKVPGYVEAVSNLFGGENRTYTAADFDALIARIDAEDQRSMDLNKAAHQRG
jgi:hypothetical protein